MNEDYYDLRVSKTELEVLLTALDNVPVKGINSAQSIIDAANQLKNAKKVNFQEEDLEPIVTE